MKYLFLLLFLFLTLNAQEIAIANHIKGEVIAKSATGSITLTNGMTLESGMILMSKASSSITILFKDHSEVILGENSILNLEKFVFKPIEKEYDFELFLEEGSMAFESGKIGELSPEDFVLKTPDGTVAIRGTKFFVKVQ